MSEHAKEPWRFDAFVPDERAYAEPQPEQRAHIWSGDDAWNVATCEGWADDSNDAEANARRICAAVNFTVGYNTAQLEGRTLAEVVDAARDFRESMVRYFLAVQDGDEILQRSAQAGVRADEERLMRVLNHFRSTDRD